MTTSDNAWDQRFRGVRPVATRNGAPTRQTSAVVRPDATYDARPGSAVAGNGAPAPVADEAPRLLTLWGARWFIVPVVIVVTAFAYGLSGLQPTRYSAQSTIRVSLLSAQSSPDQTAIAQNDLAAQYAQLASSQPVKAAAATALNIAPSSIGAVSASPLNSFNIVGITVKTASPSSSASQARALGAALVHYVTQRNAAQEKSASASVAPQLKSLDSQISRLSRTVNREQQDLSSSSSSAYVSVLPGQLSLLSSLTSQRSNIFTAQESSTSQSQPALTILDQPTIGTAVSKHQLLYAAVAFLVILLGACEIALLASRLRRSNRRPAVG